MQSRMTGVLVVLAACGGGGDGGTAPTPQSRPVASVTVTPPALSLATGQTDLLTAELRDGSGALLSGRGVIWSTTHPLTATVSDAGLVSGNAPGIATITATSEGKTGAATVTVSVPMLLSAIMGTWTGLVTEIQPCCTFQYTTVITIPGPDPVVVGALAGTVSYSGGSVQCSGELSFTAGGAGYINLSERITAGTGCALVTSAIKLGPFHSDGVRLNYSARSGNGTGTAMLSRSP